MVLYIERIYYSYGKIDLEWLILKCILIKLLDFNDKDNNFLGIQVIILIFLLRKENKFGIRFFDSKIL